MKRYRYLGGFVLLLLAVVLSACGTSNPNPNPSGLWTEKQFGTYLQNVGTKSSLSSVVGNNNALASLAGIPANGPVGNLSALANPESLQSSDIAQAFIEELTVNGLASYSEVTSAWYNDVRHLPAGIWEYNKFKNTWQKLGNSDNLIVKFWWGNIPENKDNPYSYLTLTFDWDALSPTTVVSQGSNNIEVPTGLKIKFNKDGINAGYIDVKINWYMSDCGVKTPEPSYVEVKGKFGHHGDDVAVDFGLTILKEHRQKNSGLVASFENDDYDTRIQSKGYVKVGIGKDSGKVSWDNVFKGYIFRDSNCVFTDLKIVYGEVKFGAGFTLNGKTDNLELQFIFKNIKKNQYGIQSVDLDKGAILVNDEVAVKFSGKVDNTGQKLMLVFSDKTVSLAEFLGNYLDGINLELSVGFLGLIFNNGLGELPSLPFF